MKTTHLLLIAAALVSSPAAAAAQIIGHATVIDGDTISIDGNRIRLEGIDAPETHQVCLDERGARWSCGLSARDALAGRIAGNTVTCVSTEHDRYRRALAHCSTDVDLNRFMVRVGFALAYVHYSRQYQGDEAEARNRQKGMWRGAFIAPWDWRHRNKKTEILGALSVPVSAQKQLLKPDRSSRR